MCLGAICELSTTFTQSFTNLSYSFNDIEGVRIRSRIRTMAASQNEQIAENHPLDRDEIIERISCLGGLLSETRDGLTGMWFS